MLENQVNLANKVEFHDDPNLPEKLGKMSEWITANAKTFARNAAQTLRDTRIFLADKRTRSRLYLAATALTGALSTAGCGPYNIAEISDAATRSGGGVNLGQAAGETARQTGENMKRGVDQAIKAGETVVAAIPPALQGQVDSIVAQIKAAEEQGKEIGERYRQDFAAIMAFRGGYLPEEALTWFFYNGDPTKIDLTLNSEATGSAVERWYQEVLAAGQATPSASPQP